MLKLLICLDRDGTLIQNNDYFGKDDIWQKQMKLNKVVINFLSYLQTTYKTITIVISNQSGVARGYFDKNRVDDINKYLERILTQRGIKIDDWQFCPNVDEEFVNKHPEVKFKPQYIKKISGRKPSPLMLISGLHKLQMNLSGFKKVIILGDRHEDQELSNKIRANFINVTNKSYQELLKGLSKILRHQLK